MTPKEKTKQIEKGENWIVEFWKVRGYDEVKTALGINFSLHKNPRYEGNGLNLQYLEQFEQEAIGKHIERRSKDIDSTITITETRKIFGAMYENLPDDDEELVKTIKQMSKKADLQLSQDKRGRE